MNEIMDGVLFANMDAVVTMLNPVAEDLLRTQRVLVHGKSIAELCDSNAVAASLLADADSARVEGQEFERIVEIHHADRDLAYVRANCAPVQTHDGRPAGVFVLLRDVTSEYKESQLKNQYLSIVAHELRTPLTGIKTFSTMLCRGTMGSLTDKQLELVSSIREQSIRLEHQIDKLINLGFLDSKEYHQDVQVMLVEDLVSSAVAPFEKVAKDRQIGMEVIIDRPGVAIAADRSDLRRSLQAVIENAVKFTPDGGQVTVAARPVQGGVEFSVTDTGIGIDPRYHRRIFDKFFQVEDPLTRHHGGAGLGLFVAAGILAAHKAGLQVESELGKGARFSFRLPMLDEETDEAQSAAPIVAATLE